GVSSLEGEVGELLWRKDGLLASEEVGAREKVPDRAYDGAAVPWREYLVLDAHEHHRLGPRLLALRDVEVHLVAVEVSVVGRADRRVEPERPIGKHADAVRHDRHPVEGRLPVEEDNVAVHEVPLHDVTGGEGVGKGLPVAGEIEPDLDAVRTDDVVRARVLEGPGHDELLQRLDVPAGDLVWDGELL